jgi:hypothetical protein
MRIVREKPNARSKSAKRDQDQHDNQHEAEAAASVIAGAVEATSTDAAKASQ